MRITYLNRTMRWLLQLDRPVAHRSLPEIAAEVDQNLRWNFTFHLLDGVTFWFGLSFISSTTILPLFVSKLTDSPFAVALVAMLAQGSWYFPQLFTANIIEQLPRKKPVIVNLGFFLERLPLWLLVLAAFLGVRYPVPALGLFLLGYAVHGLGAGAVAPAWQDLLANCFPVLHRGRFWGLTTFLGAGAGAASASLSAWLLVQFPFPTNFVYTFLIAAITITISWLFLAFVREPVQAVTIPRRSNRQYWQELPALLRQDNNFCYFLLARLLLAFGGMGAGFVTVTAVNRWTIADSTVGLYTAIYLVGQTIGNLTFGVLSDRYGHKLSLELCGLAAAAAYLLAGFAPAADWYFAVFGLLGFYVGGIIVSGILVVLEFAAADKRPTYTGLANTGVGAVGIAAPLVGAALASFDYTWLFGACALLNITAVFVMRYWVREPRATAVVLP